MADPHTDTQRQQQAGGWLLQEVSNAMVALHKEQFGRGPTKAQSHLAGADALLCVMEDALLPAERTMVTMGEQQRVRESRMFLQVATAEQFIATSRRSPDAPCARSPAPATPTTASSWRTSSSSPKAGTTAGHPAEADRVGSLARPDAPARAIRESLLQPRSAPSRCAQETPHRVNEVPNEWRRASRWPCAVESCLLPPRATCPVSPLTAPGLPSARATWRGQRGSPRIARALASPGHSRSPRRPAI
jgi:Na+-translocating membrane potential-generating system MpsC-like protein